MSQAIYSSGATQPDARMFYDSVWRPSVEYTLPQSFLTPKQLKDIEKSSMPKIYAKCGYNRKTSRKVLYGPEQLGGAGFIPLKVITGTGRCLNFIKIGEHLRKMLEER